MLSVYTRHQTPCTRTDIHDRRCRCPKYIQGKITPDTSFVRKSAGTQSWEKAEQVARRMESDFFNPSKERVKLEDALTAFIEQKEGQRVSTQWLYKFQRLQTELLKYAQHRGFVYLNQLTTHELTTWRSGWALAAITAAKTQERLRQFFKYCVDCDWLEKNPAKGMGRVLVRQQPTGYFTREEYERLLAVTYDEDGWPKNPYHRTRLRVLLELMRWSGLRITDAVTLERSRLQKDGRLFLYQQKTGVPVYVPLPPHVAKQLEALRNDNARYFFWSGNGDRLRVCNPWSRSLKLLFTRAKLEKRCHPHMLRDTFAVELLLAGVLLEDVSILLGHTSTKVTEKHYAPFVKARQEQIVSNVMKAWPKPTLELVKTGSGH